MQYDCQAGKDDTNQDYPDSLQINLSKNLGQSFQNLWKIKWKINEKQDKRNSWPGARSLLCKIFIYIFVW